MAVPLSAADEFLALAMVNPPRTAVEGLQLRATPVQRAAVSPPAGNLACAE